MSHSIDILFRTDRFNLSDEKPHFINPCCFGEDMLEWLRNRMIERGATVGEPIQEDWGWCEEVFLGGISYLLGVGGNSDEEAGQPNLGEWRLMVTRQRSVTDKLFGRNKEAGPLPDVLLEILRSEPTLRDVQMEEGS
ncbi:hypothetical protein [Fimbriimonas ginsengisoli]|uniref:Uncharacterized protein n=1 Tax=Fimbriimonas ginsengisoli Gsoil 348 TaxID=661478 RepID=A0A068NSJ7_FIMGI|nr:hypothetical protein [Fimbriimonas ginsengisoli]AIE84544.1 hypothetical protein OP10G_1176 [Fimbriimonas ginsengisoli Gsoil 348]